MSKIKFNTKRYIARMARLSDNYDNIDLKSVQYLYGVYSRLVTSVYRKDSRLSTFELFLEYASVEGMESGHKAGIWIHEEGWVPGNIYFREKDMFIGLFKKIAINSTGWRGVHENKRTGKFTSSVCINRISTFLGYFDTEAEAYDVYRNIAIEKSIVSDSDMRKLLERERRDAYYRLKSYTSDTGYDK